MTSPTSRRTSARLLVIVLAVFVALAIAVVAGWFDWLLGGAGHSRAFRSLSVYLVLCILFVWLRAIWSRRRTHILIATATALSALVLFDISARVLALPVGAPAVANMGLFSPEFHHRYPAHQTLRLSESMGASIVHTNEDGFRTRHERSSFRELGPRVALLGDSFTFGLGVEDGEELPARLEQELRRRTGNERIGVLNTGIVSYSPYLERILLEEVVLEYHPDLVVLLLDATDIGDDLVYENEATVSDGRPSFDFEDDARSFRNLGPAWNVTKPVRENLQYPFRVARRAFKRWRKDPGYQHYRFDLTLGGEREKNRFFIYRHPLDLTREYFERTLSNIVAVASVARSADAEFALVILPRFHHWNPDECPDNWESYSYALDEPHQFEYFRFFREAAPALDFPVFDLLPAFQATDEFPLVMPDDPHWNPAGHSFVARTLADYFLSSGLLARERAGE